MTSKSGSLARARQIIAAEYGDELGERSQQVRWCQVRRLTIVEPSMGPVSHDPDAVVVEAPAAIRNQLTNARLADEVLAQDVMQALRQLPEDFQRLVRRRFAHDDDFVSQRKRSLELRWFEDIAMLMRIGASRRRAWVLLGEGIVLCEETVPDIASRAVVGFFGLMLAVAAVLGTVGRWGVFYARHADAPHSVASLAMRLGFLVVLGVVTLLVRFRRNMPVLVDSV